MKIVSLVAILILLSIVGASVTLWSTTKHWSFNDTEELNALKTRIMLNNRSILQQLTGNEEVRKVMNQNNLTLINARKLWVIDIRPITQGLYLVKMEVEITPILYMKVTTVVSKNSLRIVRIIGSPRFTLIPPPEVNSQLDKMILRAQTLLANESNDQKILISPTVVALAKSKGIPIKVLADALKKGIHEIGLTFDVRTGKLKGYIVTLQLLKSKKNGNYKWVADPREIQGKCVEDLTINVYFTEDNTNSIKVIKTVVIDLPACLHSGFATQTHP